MLVRDNRTDTLVVGCWMKDAQPRASFCIKTRTSIGSLCPNVEPFKCKLKGPSLSITRWVIWQSKTFTNRSRQIVKPQILTTIHHELTITCPSIHHDFTMNSPLQSIPPLQLVVRQEAAGQASSYLRSYGRRCGAPGGETPGSALWEGPWWAIQGETESKGQEWLMMVNYMANYVVNCMVNCMVNG